MAKSIGLAHFVAVNLYCGFISGFILSHLPCRAYWRRRQLIFLKNRIFSRAHSSRVIFLVSW